IRPSGSGKSSVVKAGLIPAIRKGRITPWQRWFIVEMTPASQPLNELNNALVKVATQAAESIQDQLHQEDGLNRAINAALPPNDTELILVLDQFEEVFTQTTAERHRAHFLRLLSRGVTAADSRLRLIITLRADFYDRPLLYAGFGELMRQRTEIVLPMSAEELSAAVSGPAQRVGLVLDDGLVDRIVDSVIEQPGSLPLLQFTLSELYERRKKDRLTLKAYDAIGGVSGALAGRADELYDQLSPAQQTIAQQMFLRLVTPGEGAEDTRRRALQSELLSLAPDENDVLYVMESFGKHRLFTFDHDPTTRTPTVEIAHEALIRSWGTLRLWLDQNRSDLRLQRQ